MVTPSPFKIKIPDQNLDVLRRKLDLARLPDQPEGYDINQGVPAPQMQKILDHWKKDYLPKWRQHEAKLNELPMFTLPIESDGFGTLNIHFVHARSTRQDAIPLLFVHGWPGSFLEVSKLLHGLTEPEVEGAQAFHVVAPSLPNYGFSDGVKKRGFNLRHYGFVLNKLMLNLGYAQYVAQGGDWGSIITRTMGRHHDQSLRAIHVNLAAFDILNLLKQPWLILLALIWPPFWPTRQGFDGLSRGMAYVSGGNDYYRLQSSRPQTVAYCLEDSPVGLLGWMYEKLVHWTDDYPWTEDEVLTWISVYWFSQAGPGASVRTYFEAEHPSKEWNGMSSDRKFWEWMTNASSPDLIKRQYGMLILTVQTFQTKPRLGISQFPRDIVGVPSVLARTLGPIAFEQFHSTGGHFAAWEKPDMLVKDLRNMFGPGGGAYGVVHPVLTGMRDTRD